MEKWDYLETTVSEADLSRILREWGNGGWELVTMAAHAWSPHPSRNEMQVGYWKLVFKRRMP